MNKPAVLISIRPEWVEKILSGEKTIEIRKTFPHDHMPFKCYIYCTKYGGTIAQPRYKNVPLDKTNVWEIGNGRVVAEFICDRMDYTYGLSCEQRKETCMKFDQIEQYAPGKWVYLWHISNLKIYDKPKELGEFTATTTRKEFNRQLGRFEYKERTGSVQRPPQSWMYVEELEGQE